MSYLLIKCIHCSLFLPTIKDSWVIGRVEVQEIAIQEFKMWTRD
jgi:hypothetical protein